MSAKKSGTPFILFVAVILLGLGVYFLWNRPPVGSDAQNTSLNTNGALFGVGGADTDPALNTGEQQEKDETVVNENLNVNDANTNAESNAADLVNDTYGFRLDLPEGWTAKEQSSSGIYSVDFSDGSTMSVLSADEEELVRASFTVIAERTVLASGISASRISATSLKDGSAMEVLFVPDDPYVYHFRGTSNFIDMIQEQLIVN
jgi:hypothetical protein